MISRAKDTHILLKEPIRFEAQVTLHGGPSLRVWTAPGQSHLLPSAWLDIPKNGWLVIELCR